MFSLLFMRNILSSIYRSVKIRSQKKSEEDDDDDEKCHSLQKTLS